VREGTGERAVVDGGGAHVVYCVKENGRGVQVVTSLAGLPAKAQQAWQACLQKPTIELQTPTCVH
jgi:hypothetical protein